MTDFICDYIVPILFTAVSGWMCMNVICLAIAGHIFAEDMAAEDAKHSQDKASSR